MLQKEFIIRLVLGLLLIPGAVHAAPRLTFSPETTQSQPSVPCSSGATQSFRIGEIKNIGDSRLAISAIVIQGAQAKDFAFDTLAEPTPEGFPSMLSETLYLEATNGASDPEPVSIPVSVLCALQREASGLLQAEVVIVSNDPTTPKLTFPFSAQAVALPNLALGQLEGTLSAATFSKATKRAKTKSFTLNIPLANLAQTPTQLPVEVLVSLEIRDPKSNTVIKRLRKKVSTPSELSGPGLSILTVRFDKIPAQAIKFEQSLRMYVTGAGRVVVDPKRRILEGNETLDGKTAQLEFEDNTTSFSVLSKADIRHGF